MHHWNAAHQRTKKKTFYVYFLWQSEARLRGRWLGGRSRYPFTSVIGPSLLHLLLGILHLFSFQTRDEFLRMILAWTINGCILILILFDLYHPSSFSFIATQSSSDFRWCVTWTESHNFTCDGWMVFCPDMTFRGWLGIEKKLVWAKLVCCAKSFDFAILGGWGWGGGDWLTSGSK